VSSIHTFSAICTIYACLFPSLSIRKEKQRAGMNLKRKRVAFLLTGVLPLMAKDDIPVIKTSDKEVKNAQNDVSSLQSAAEKIHDNDALTSIPKLLPLQLTDVRDHVSSLSPMFLTDDQISFEEGFISRINDKITRTAFSNTTCLASEDPSLQEQKAKEEDGKVGVESQSEVDSTNVTLNDTIIADEAASSNHSETENEPAVEEEEEMVERLIVDYASKSAGALILESSPKMKGAGNLLVGDKDKYAISPCTEKKFVVIGLSEDILVKEIKVANYERYSSHVKEFQVLGSQTMGQWVVLGNFSAENKVSYEQSFELEEPSWARYLKFRFMTHYGSEHYCTLSQIKVHGSTMLQGFHEQWNEGEVDNEGEETSDRKPDDIQQEEPVEIDEKEKEVTKLINLEDVIESNQNPGTLENENDDGISEIVEDNSNQRDSSPNNEELTGEEEEDEKTLPADGRESKSKMTLLLPTFDINTASIPNDLASTRFLLSAHKSLNTDVTQCQVEPLDTVAISNDFRNQGNGFEEGLAASEESTGKKGKQNYSVQVTDAVQKLQMKIQSTIGMTAGFHQTIQTMIGNTLPRLKPYIENTPQTQNISQPNSSQHTLKTETRTDTDTIQNLDTQAFASDAASTVIDERTLDIEISAGLTKVLSQFPSAKCLESLNFNEFKKNTLAKAAAGTGSSGSHAGKIEPIFKTLTDEIRMLQISQNVHDKFSRALIACYQNIMIEMASELHAIHTSQEQRLSKLEAEIAQMKNDDWISNLSFICSKIVDLIISFFMVAINGSSQTLNTDEKVEGKRYALMVQFFLIMTVISVSMGWFRRQSACKPPAGRKAPKSNPEPTPLRRIVSFEKLEEEPAAEDISSIQTEGNKRTAKKMVGRGRFRRTVARIVAPGAKTP